MKEENYIIFDQYLQDELSAEEKATFEKELTEDAEMAASFATFKELQAHLENKFGNETDLNAFKANLKTISEAHFENKKTKVIRFKPWQYAAAASVALLFGLFFFNQQSTPSFDDYNQFENAAFTERGTLDANLKQAENAFNAKKYQEAIRFFEAILIENRSAEIQYFYGVSLLETNEFQKAEAVFVTLQTGSSIYKNKAVWGLALVKLKQKDYKSCKVFLEAIPADYEDYDKVKELLDKLD